MKNLSPRFTAALFGESMDEVVAVLITITHPLLGEPLRLSSDATLRLSDDPLRYGTLSRGRTYDYVPVTLTFPADKQDAPPTIDLHLAMVGREAVPLLRSALEPASVTIEVVLASHPDAVEAVYPDFDLVSAQYGGDDATITLSVDMLATEPFPAGSFTPASFPAMF